MHCFSMLLWLMIYIQNRCFAEDMPVTDSSTKTIVEQPLSNFIQGGIIRRLRTRRSSFNSPSTASVEHNSDVTQYVPHSEINKISAGHERYQVASVDFDHVSSPYIITLWIFISGLAKIGFQVTPKLRMICPESCVLLLIGITIGLVLYFSGVPSVNSLTPHVFFMYLLPPIVLDAGYFMPNRLFFDNLVTILMFAVIGTVWNAIAIGFSLWAVGLTGLYKRSLPLLHTLLFSSIISAVDPVAVLAVFEEIHVNEILYIIVFGESLLNDAVTVVLYHMFEGYTKMGVMNILPEDYVTGVASFFVVAIGGTAMGIVSGILAAFISRFTHHVLVIEPLFVFIMAYLSYLTAELFHLSGILALTFCGITMKNYIEENVSQKSHVTVKYTMKMLASSSETIIFVLLGVATVGNKHEWNTWFVLFSIIFCLVYRAVGVIVLTAIVNRFRLHRLNMVEQFIMSYGGLRGAVAFALVLVIDEELIPSKNMMLTAVISVVYFTVFFQGTTIGFFVNTLNVPKSNKMQLTMSERLHITVIDHLMAGIEGISDHSLGNFKVRDKFKYYNNKIFRPLLTKNAKLREPKIFYTHSKLNLDEALQIVNSNKNLDTISSPNAGLSLSSLLKSYSGASQNRLALEDSHERQKNATLLNVDIGELTYSPSSKDLAAVDVHHILEDSIFKPKRKARRYSRSEINEPLSKPPLFPHQIRVQVSRRMFESRKYRGRNNYGQTTSKRYQQAGKARATASGTDVKNCEDEISDAKVDEGVNFTVGQNCWTSNDQDFRTATETTLPWKRDLGSKGKVSPSIDIRIEEAQINPEPRFNIASPPFHTAHNLKPAHNFRRKSIASDRRYSMKSAPETVSRRSIHVADIETHSANIADHLTSSDPRDVHESRGLPVIIETNGQNIQSETLKEDIERTDSADSLNIEGPDSSLFVHGEEVYNSKYKQ